MFGILIGSLLAGALPMFVAGETVHGVKEMSLAEMMEAETERLIEEEKKNPKYNIPRQEHIEKVVGSCEGWEKEFYPVLGWEPTVRLFIASAPKAEHMRAAFVKAISEKEGWTIWYDPHNIMPLDPEFKKYHPDPRVVKQRYRRMKREERR